LRPHVHRISWRRVSAKEERSVSWGDGDVIDGLVDVGGHDVQDGCNGTGGLAREAKRSCERSACLRFKIDPHLVFTLLDDRHR